MNLILQQIAATSLKQVPRRCNRLLLVLQNQSLVSFPIRPPQKRRSAQLPPDFVPRRSSRLARKGFKSSEDAPIRHIQHDLIRRLGIASGKEAVSTEALDKYGRFFSNPLSESHIKALVALFGWTVPENVENLETIQFLAGDASAEFV
jgi:hypothetical protein